MALLIMAIIATALLIYARKLSKKQSGKRFDSESLDAHSEQVGLMDDKGSEIQSLDGCSRPSQNLHVGSQDEKEYKVKNLRYFCIKDKGYHVSVWPKDQGFQGLDYIEFNIAGITHGEHVDDHLGEFAATLEPDHANPYDAQAIKILARNCDRVGYVPKDITSNVRAFTQLPCKCYCYIGKNNDMYFTDCYIKKESK